MGDHDATDERLDSAGERVDAPDRPDGTGARTTTRRSVLRVGAAGAVGLAAGTAVVGTGSADEVAGPPPLTRAGNELRDPSGNRVTLRGVAVADPGRQLRPWRELTADETVALALDETARPPCDTWADRQGIVGWHNDVIRLPVQPQDVYSGTDNAELEPWTHTPHGDQFGPVLPGETGGSPPPITEATLTEYFGEIVDPLIDQIEAAGAYATIAYYRDFPVFHQVERDWSQLTDDGAYSCGDAVETSVTFEYDEGGCGERGVLWHGADQVEAVEDAAADVYGTEVLSDVTPWTERAAVAEALDAEVRTFWAFVADRYADRDHVLFDLFYAPTGPYEGDWGAPDRTPETVSEDPNALDPRDHAVWWDLWRERAQPWVDVVESHAPGSVVTVGSPRWSQYTYHAGATGEFDRDALQLCYSAHVPAATEWSAEDQIASPASTAPVFLGDVGWEEPPQWGFGDAYHATTEEGRDRYEPLLEGYPVHPIANWFDFVWEPRFFRREEVLDATDPDLMRHVESYESSAAQWWMSYTASASAADAATATESTDGSRTTGCTTRTERPPGPAPVGTHSASPGDPDEDGNYEDVNANGRQDIADAVDLFRHREDVDPEFFDFNRSGSMDIGDAVALFRENAG